MPRRKRDIVAELENNGRLFVEHAERNPCRRRSEMDDDRLADLRRQVAARIPEMSPAEFEALAAPDPDALPTEVASRILEVVDAFADKLEAAVGAMQGKADRAQR